VSTHDSYELWAKRWREGQTGWNEGRPNDLLAAHVARIETETKRRLRIFVPLAGKAFDLRWLAERGHEVVGIEIVWDAVKAFFDDQGVVPETKEIGGKPALVANGVTLVCGDIFDASPDDLGRFDVVYDRAALVALEPSTRARYVATCRALLAEGGVTFLVSFAYDQSKAPGPPWSLDDAAVRELYTGRSIEVLATRSVPISKRLSEGGVAALEETAYLIA
jgi:thiopurine S-methyltransferase